MSARLEARLGRSPSVAELAAEMDLLEEEVLEALEASTAYQTASLDERLYDEDGSGSTLGDVLGSEDDGFELVEDRSAAQSAMCALDDRARQIVELRFIAGMTQSQIGTELGISQMHVSRLLRRALAKLRETAAADASGT